VKKTQLRNWWLLNLLESPMKLKLYWPSRPETPIHVCDPAIPELFIPGISVGEIIAMVCSTSFNPVIYFAYLLPASLTMYQRARKLEDVITDATSFVSLAESQLEALSVATNALSLVDEKSSWIVMPVMPDAVSKPIYVSLMVLRLF
jgi:hypothetical protein